MINYNTDDVGYAFTKNAINCNTLHYKRTNNCSTRDFGVNKMTTPMNIIESYWNHSWDGVGMTNNSKLYTGVDKHTIEILGGTSKSCYIFLSSYNPLITRSDILYICRGYILALWLLHLVNLLLKYVASFSARMC